MNQKYMSFFHPKSHTDRDSGSSQIVKLSIIFSFTFGFTLLLSLLIVGVFVIQKQKSQLTTSTENGMQFLAQAYASNVRNYLGEQKEKMRLFSNSNVVNLASLNRKLSDILADNDDFKAISVVDHEGTIIASAHSELIGKNDQEHAHEVNQIDEVIVSEVHYSETLGEYTVDFLAPIYTNEERTEQAGTMVAVLSIEKLAKVANPSKISGDFIDAYLTDNRGVLLTPSKYLKGENKGVLTQMVDNKNVQDCLRANADFIQKGASLEKHIPQIGLYSDFRGEEVLGTHEHIIDPPWCLIVEGEKGTLLDQPTKQIIQVFLILGTVLVSMFMSIGYFLPRVVTKYLL